MRFLHIADVHLDTPFAGRSQALRTRLRDAALEALERCVSAAIDEKVHAVLIAGDLLDGAHLSFRTERHLLTQLKRLDDAGIQVVYATGNHDPGDSARIRALAWPSCVTLIAAGDPVTVTIGGEGGAPAGHVVGAGYAGAQEHEDLAARLRPASGTGLPQVALLHTEVATTGEGADATASRPAAGPYAPSSVALMRRAGFDYWALGHVHAPREVSARPPIRYPGCLQGRQRGEAGPRGGLLVDLADPRIPVIEFREFAPVRWERLEVSGLRAEASLEAVLGAVEAAWGPERDASSQVVAVELAGPCPMWRQLRDPAERDAMADAIAERLGAIDVELRTDRVGPPVRAEDHLERPDVLGAVLQLVREVTAGRDRIGLRQEDLAGFDAGRDGTVERYLARLLRGAAEEAVELMLDGDPEADG